MIKVRNVTKKYIFKKNIDYIRGRCKVFDKEYVLLSNICQEITYTMYDYFS